MPGVNRSFSIQAFNVPTSKIRIKFCPSRGSKHNCLGNMNNLLKTRRSLVNTKNLLACDVSVTFANGIVLPLCPIWSAGPYLGAFSSVLVVQNNGQCSPINLELQKPLQVGLCIRCLRPGCANIHLSPFLLCPSGTWGFPEGLVIFLVWA